MRLVKLRPLSWKRDTPSFGFFVRHVIDACVLHVDFNDLHVGSQRRKASLQWYGW